MEHCGIPEPVEQMEQGVGAARMGLCLVLHHNSYGSWRGPGLVASLLKCRGAGIRNVRLPIGFWEQLIELNGDFVALLTGYRIL